MGHQQTLTLTDVTYDSMKLINLFEGFTKICTKYPLLSNAAQPQLKHQLVRCQNIHCDVLVCTLYPNLLKIEVPKGTHNPIFDSVKHWANKGDYVKNLVDFQNNVVCILD